MASQELQKKTRNTGHETNISIRSFHKCFSFALCSGILIDGSIGLSDQGAMKSGIFWMAWYP